MKLPCVQCMYLFIPRSVVGLLCRGSYLSPRWQCPLLVPWGPGLLCKDVRTSYSSLVLFSVWHLLIVIDGYASSDWLLGLMLVKVRYVVCACVTRCMRRVGVISDIFSLFFVI